MDNSIKLIVDSFGKDRFKFDEPLADYTALKIGGPAKVFFIAFTQRELTRMVTMCRETRVPFFLFGTGSKIAISDFGFDGIVIKNRTKSIKTVSVKGKVTKFGIDVDEATIEVDGGVSMNKWVEYLDSEKLESVEFDNIPGSIGGNLFISRFLQNRTKSIKVLDSASEIEKIEVGSLRPKSHIILSVVFQMKARK